MNCNVSARTQSARRINSFNMLCMHVKHNAVRPRGKCNGHNLGPAISNAQTFEATTLNVRQHFRDDQMSGSTEGGEAVEAKVMGEQAGAVGVNGPSHHWREGAISCWWATFSHRCNNGRNDLLIDCD